MHARKEPKFKLPPIRPERQDPNATTLVKKCETSISITRDNVRLNPELDFLVEQQRNEELCRRLHRKRHTAKFFREKLQKQWEVLEQNELAFQRTIVTHNKFLRRNLEKRERALAKIQTDQDLTKKREKEIKVLELKYDFFNDITNKMRKEIKKHSVYEDYLSGVVELEDSPFKNEFEFLAKYESLQLVKERCIEKQTDEMASTVLMHDSNVEFFRFQDIILIGLRNDLNNLRCKFDDICRKNLSTESLITSIVNRTNELNAEVSTCEYMIDAIYRYMCHRRKIPYCDYSLGHVQPKIDILKSTLGGWEKIMYSANLAKNKKKTKELRKSRLWKQSISQGVFNWKRKTPTKQTDAEILENMLKNSSILRY